MLEIILLPLAHHWQFWFDARDAVVYAVFILIGKVFWHIVDYSKNVKTAADVNRRLKERRSTEQYINAKDGRRKEFRVH